MHERPPPVGDIGVPGIVKHVAAVSQRLLDGAKVVRLDEFELQKLADRLHRLLEAGILASDRPSIRSVVPHRAEEQRSLNAVVGHLGSHHRRGLARERDATVGEQKATLCGGRVDIGPVEELPRQVDQVVVQAQADAQSELSPRSDAGQALAEQSPDRGREHESREAASDSRAVGKWCVDGDAKVVCGEFSQLDGHGLTHGPCGCRVGDDLHVRPFAPCPDGKVDEAHGWRRRLGSWHGLARL